MGLPRFILFAILIGGAFWLWRRINQRSQRASQPSPVQTKVCCAHCHVHLPEDRATAGNAQLWFCSPEYRALGAKTRD